MIDTPLYDCQEIQRGLDILVPEGAIEIRAFRGNTLGGLFDDREAMISEIIRLSGTVPGVFFTLNPVDLEKIGPPNNRMIDSIKQTITDDLILHRARLLLDFDPVRPANTPATDEEHMLAIDRAHRCKEWLINMNWPEPALIDSGNGAHLLFGLDLPNEPESLALIKRVLAAVAFFFSDDLVEVDQTVCNAARLCRLAGTLNRKGTATDERPYRLAHIINAPDELVPVSREMMEAIASLIPKHSPQVDGAKRQKHTPFDIAEWIRNHNISIFMEGQWPGHKGGYRWILNTCPWNSDHSNKASYIIRFADGGIAAGCLHNGCCDKDWPALRDIYEPDWRDTEMNPATKTKSNPSEKHAVLQRLMEISNDIELFHTPAKEPYAMVPVVNRH